MSSPWIAAGWRRALVYGLGLSGCAAARLLRARGIPVVACDRRPAGELGLGELATDPGVELLLGGEPVDLPPGVEGVVVSPGVPLDRPLLVAARSAGLPIVAEVELAFALLDGPLVGITGSNGKSTTTALAGALLAGSGFAVEVCGNIGVPLSSRVAGPPGRVFVVELSSFQLETTTALRPRAAALLNVSPDHLDRHRTLAEYLAAKARLFAYQTAEDVAVLNADEPVIAALPTPGRRRFFSTRSAVADGCYLVGDRVVETAPGSAPRTLFRCADLPLAGVHNLENAMAAALLARAVGADPAALPAALAGFRGLPHRLERVAERRGVVFYDDSKGTNVAATARSIEGFTDRTVHLILGGRNKGADLRYLRPIVERKATRIYLIGESASDFERALTGAAPAIASGTLARAVAAAAEAAATGEVVVLSPACASFDQFRDYVDRGEQFQRLVRTLVEEGRVGQEAGV